jgi:hypothetical protein
MGIASDLYGVIFLRAFFGATCGAVPLLFQRPFQPPNRFEHLLSSWATLSPRRWTLVVCHRRYCLLAPLADEQAVDRKAALRQTIPNLAERAQTILRWALED